MHVEAARLAFRFGEHHRLLAEDERGGGAEEVRGDDRAPGRHRVRAFDDGNNVAAGVGHESDAASLSSPSPWWGRVGGRRPPGWGVRHAAIPNALRRCHLPDPASRDDLPLHGEEGVRFPASIKRRSFRSLR